MLQVFEPSATISIPATSQPDHWGTDFGERWIKTQTSTTIDPGTRAKAKALRSFIASGYAKPDVTVKTEMQNKSGLAQSEAIDALRTRLGEISTLEDNWDSYGAMAPTATALKQAELLVINLDKNFGWELGQLAVPHEAFPNPDGGIELEWSVGDRVLGLEIGPEGRFRFLLKNGHGSSATYEHGETRPNTSKIGELLLALR
jgi:hypothetical protein